MAWFLCDDAFISFRYARNLLEGHGLVFNPGERVEGYTNLLWVLELAALWGAFGLLLSGELVWLDVVHFVRADHVIAAVDGIDAQPRPARERLRRMHADDTRGASLTT